VLEISATIRAISGSRMLSCEDECCCEIGGKIRNVYKEVHKVSSALEKLNTLPIYTENKSNR
jgi:hypothetical protein